MYIMYLMSPRNPIIINPLLIAFYSLVRKENGAYANLPHLQGARQPATLLDRYS